MRLTAMSRGKRKVAITSLRTNHPLTGSYSGTIRPEPTKAFTARLDEDIAMLSPAEERPPISSIC
jgi:hypothetical protein